MNFNSAAYRQTYFITDYLRKAKTICLKVNSVYSMEGEKRKKTT